MIVAIIPARGGSKRIPRKNIRAFAGRPIIAYSIEAARGTGLFDRIIVSTDDAEVAEVARANGAETPFVRPPQLSDDHTGTNDVVKHSLQWLIDSGSSAEYACCIYATAPLLTSSVLRRGYEKLIESGRSFTFGVTSFEFPIQRALRVKADGSVEPAYPEHYPSRSQDLEPMFHDVGQFYWGRAEAFIAGKAMASAEAAVIALPHHIVQDIDTPEDWERAEAMYRVLQERTIAVRPATFDDAAFLFECRNDPRTRNMSKSTAPLDWDGHIRWLHERLAREQPRLFVVEDMQRTPVGVVRLDGDKISYIVAAPYRNRGFAGKMLRWAAATYGSLIAEIKPGNEASIRAATNAGHKVVILSQ